MVTPEIVPASVVPPSEKPLMLEPKILFTIAKLVRWDITIQSTVKSGIAGISAVLWRYYIKGTASKIKVPPR